MERFKLPYLLADAPNQLTCQMADQQASERVLLETVPDYC
jgi:hypothetical protein